MQSRVLHALQWIGECSQAGCARASTEAAQGWTQGRAMEATPAPAGKEWFEGDAASTADVPPLSSGGVKRPAQVQADPQNAVANAAAGMLGVWLTEKVPFVGTLVNKVSGTLNINEQMKQLQYGPWGDFLMPAGGYSRPTAQELRGKVMTNVGSYGGYVLCCTPRASGGAGCVCCVHGCASVQLIARASVLGAGGARRNYLTLGSGLSVAGVFFHPMLLMLIGVLYYANRRIQGDEPIVVMGRQLGGELPG